MQSAILYGLNNGLKDVSQQLAFHCETGNCTWTEEYTSLAICSRCKDLSSLLKRGSGGGWLPEELDIDGGGASAFSATGGTKFTLPNTLQFSAENGWGYMTKNDTLDPYDQPYGLFLTSFATTNQSLSVSMQDINTLILSLTVIRIPPDLPGDRVLLWPNIPLEAAECALYYCVNSYQSNVTNGVLAERVEEQTSVQRATDSWLPLPHSADGFRDDTYYTPRYKDSIAYVIPQSYTPRSDLMLGDSFNLSQAAVDSISSYMQGLFISSTINRKNLEVALNGFYMTDGQEQYSPDVVQVLRSSPNLTDLFQGVATSMTNALRVGADNSTTQSGLAGHIVTKYRIEWAWICLPLGVVFATLAHLLSSMFNSRTSAAPLWKSSALAVLSKGKYTVGVLDDSDSRQAMEEAADKFRVNLFPINGQGDDIEASSTSDRSSKDTAYKQVPQDIRQDN